MFLQSLSLVVGAFRPLNLGISLVSFLFSLPLSGKYDNGNHDGIPGCLYATASVKHMKLADMQGPGCDSGRDRCVYVVGSANLLR